MAVLNPEKQGEYNLKLCAALVYFAATEQADDGIGALLLISEYYPQCRPVAKKIYNMELRDIFGVEFDDLENRPGDLERFKEFIESI